MTETKEETNTKIWKKLCETDPKYTKDFKKGFSGTAINPTYGVKKLTEAFGPCGVGWGTEIVDSRFFEGAWFNEKDRETIHTIILKLWYKRELDSIDEKEAIHVAVKNEVFGVGTTTFIGRNKNGIYTDEEFFKKTMTDALSNASKQLGLSADIFMGLYDDSKYLNEVKQKFAPPPLMPKRSAVNKALTACSTKEQYEKTWDSFNDKYPDIIDNPSGHPTKKDETWNMLFGVHYDRIMGVSPINNDGPDKLQEEFTSMTSTCQDRDTLLMIEQGLERNKALQTKENYKVLETLHMAYPE